ncbi:thermonuclease family protein [Hymenobacter latericus]|uniref:thermonuclease family protein n=1 Tax=Hymenobacter sp. YIM 151858-1 TaxID=2987688 RepID=UPI002227973A|nr:thermonuclease family protein [Hymenobacter sp. YIM 151858-1]UYZ60190.1 thermonuclease family protein [Hymenobacter sp. YIM 151858-1]
MHTSELRHLLPKAGLPPVHAPAAGSRPGWVWGSVRQVLDGDTYDVQLPAGRFRARLQEVDAPELGQPYGRQAADSVAALLRGRSVQLMVTGKDGYGRGLVNIRWRSARGWVRLDSVAVVRGWAWAYNPRTTTPGLAPQQQLAQARHRGLWKCGTAAPIRPAVWRAYNKQEKIAGWGRCSW